MSTGRIWRSQPHSETQYEEQEGRGTNFHLTAPRLQRDRSTGRIWRSLPHGDESCRLARAAAGLWTGVLWEVVRGVRAEAVAGRGMGVPRV